MTANYYRPAYAGYPRFPTYRSRSGYTCPCGGMIELCLWGNTHMLLSNEGIIGFCCACGRQFPFFRPATSEFIPGHPSDPQIPASPAPYSPSYPFANWYRDSGRYYTEPDTYSWGSQRQFYQQPSTPQLVNRIHHPSTAQEPLRTQHNNSSFNTNYYRGGYEIPRSTEPRRPSPAWTLVRRPPTPIPGTPWPCERERGRAHEISTSGYATDPTAWANSRRSTSSIWSTQNNNGGRRTRSVSSSGDSIRYTPSPQPDEDQIGIGIPCELPDGYGSTTEGEELEGDDQEEPFIFTRDGSVLLLGEQWQVPSRAEAIREAGEPVGRCDIVSTHETTDETGNTVEIDIKEENCREPLVMSGGLAE
ncbi:hypothetical protein F4774DRAFT_247916 [Daldinia eschscholtzii]|nr:hypothetical protein F4774DRAFT_247916 [Daldinia eschscholtzii]